MAGVDGKGELPSASSMDKARPMHCCLAIGLGLFVGALRGLGAEPGVISLAGAIDFHCHSAPDAVARSINSFEVVRQARAAGSGFGRHPIGHFDSGRKRGRSQHRLFVRPCGAASSFDRLRVRRLGGGYSRARSFRQASS